MLFQVANRVIYIAIYLYKFRNSLLFTAFSLLILSNNSATRSFSMPILYDLPQGHERLTKFYQRVSAKEKTLSISSCRVAPKLLIRLEGSEDHKSDHWLLFSLS